MKDKDLRLGVAVAMKTNAEQCNFQERRGKSGLQGRHSIGEDKTVQTVRRSCTDSLNDFCGEWTSANLVRTLCSVRSYKTTLLRISNGVLVPNVVVCTHK